MLINEIAEAYKGGDKSFTQGSVDIESMSTADKALELENALIRICDNIAYISFLVDRKNIDIDLLLQIVASYLIGIQEGGLDKDTTLPPKQLFEESLFPTIETIETEVIKETINDTDTTTNEEHATKETAN